MRNMSNGSRALAALTALACVGGAAACGSSSSSGSKSATGATKTIVVGQNAIESGPAATSYPQTLGFEAYLNYINSTGGVNGYKFSYVSEDNAYQATQGVEAQAKLNAQNPFTSFVVGTVIVSAVIPSLNSQGYKGTLFASADGGLIQKLTTPNLSVWGVVPAYQYLVRYDANFIMNNLSTKSFAYAYENDSLTADATPSVETYVPASGGTLAIKLPVPHSTTNFVPLATQLQSSGAKTVLAWMDSPTLVGLQKAADQIGYKPVWVTPFFSLTSGYLKLAGSLSEGTYIDGYLPPATSSEAPVQLYATWISQLSPTAVQGGEIGWQSAAAFISGFRKATAGGKKATATGLATAMRQVNGTVALEKLDFTKTNWGSTQAAMYQVKNGAFDQVAAPSSIPGT
jgi:branched-chain amino acid transport system substrate-binding protein